MGQISDMYRFAQIDMFWVALISCIEAGQRVKQRGTGLFDQLFIMCLGISTLPAASQTKVFFKRPFLHFALRKILYSFMITLEG